MRRNLLIAAKAVLYFLILGFAVPQLLNIRITAGWVLGAAAISLVITVPPAYLIARLREKKASDRDVGQPLRAIINALNKKLVQAGCGALFMFVLMVFITPTLEGRKTDTAWVVISAITSLVAGTAFYLIERYKKKVNER